MAKVGVLTAATTSVEFDWPGGPGSVDVGHGASANFDSGTVELQYQPYVEPNQAAVWKKLDSTDAFTFTAAGEGNFDFQAARMRMVITGGGGSENVPFRVGRSPW